MRLTRATLEVLRPGVEAPAGAVVTATQAVRRRDDLEALAFRVAFRVVLLVVAVTLGAAPLV